MRLARVKIGDLVVVRWPGYGRFIGRVYMLDRYKRRIGVLTPTGTGIAVSPRACAGAGGRR